MERTSVEAARSECGGGLRLSLLDGFDLRLDGGAVALSVGAERLVAFLALHLHPVQRPYVAGTLWPETSEQRAFANLRSCLWRVKRPGIPLVIAANRRLALAPRVQVDYRESSLVAQRLMHDHAAAPVTESNLTLLTRTLLPDWYDDWVLLEREYHRQLCLLALESLAQRLAAVESAAALECALAAVALEPLRESAHRTVIEIHLATGNLCEALRQYRLFRRVLASRLGLEPSPALRAVMSPVLGDAAVTLR